VTILTHRGVERPLVPTVSTGATTADSSVTCTPGSRSIIVALIGLPHNPARPVAVEHWLVQVRPEDPEPVDTVTYDVGLLKREHAEAWARRRLGPDLRFEHYDLAAAIAQRTAEAGAR